MAPKRENPTAVLAELLAAMSRQPISRPEPQDTQTNLASALLANSRINMPKKAETSGTSGPSVLSRIIDVLSRPNYAVAETLNRLKNDIHDIGPEQSPLDILSGIPAGLSGQKKTTFTGIFKADREAQGEESTFLGDFLPGLALDIFTDPTTYLGVGAISKIGKAFKGEKAAIPIAERAPFSINESVADALPVPSGGPSVPGAVDASRSLLRGADQPLIPAQPGMRQGIGNAPIKIPSDLRWEMLAKNYEPKHGVTPKNIDEAELAQYKTEFSDMMKPTPRTDDEKAADLIAHTLMGRLPDNLKNDLAKNMSRAERMEMDRAIARHAESMKKGKSKGGKRPKPPVADFKTPFRRAEDIVADIAKGDPRAATEIAPKINELPPLTQLDQALGNNVGRNAIKNMKIAKDKHLNPVQQLELYRNALKRTTASSPAERLFAATQILRATETFLETQGIGMKWWDGSKIKLSEAIQEMGNGEIPLEVLRQFQSKNPIGGMATAIENLRAKAAISDSPMADLAISQMTKKVAEANVNLNPARAAQVQKGIEDEVRTALGAANVSPGNIDGTLGIVRDVLRSRVPAAQQALNRNQRNINLLLSGAPGAKVVWQDINAAVNRAIEAQIGVTAIEAGTQLGKGNKAVEFLGTRFATFYGMRDIKPFEMDHLLSAESNAAKRGALWSSIAKSTEVQQRVGAFQAAQGKLPPADALEEGVADHFRDVMERLFSSTGIKNEAESVSLRAGMTMESLNNELRRVGSEHYFHKSEPYAEGTDWLKSWEDWDVTGDPINTMAKVELAVERLAGKNALYDDIASRWGVRKPTGEHRYKIGDPRFDGVYFDKEMASQIQRTLANLDNIYEPGSKAAKYFDAIQRIWKTHVTIYSPSHHVTNAIGDGWLSWMAGVNNPLVYKRAADVLKAQKGRYGTLDDVEALIGKGASARPGIKQVAKFRGQSLSADDIYIAAHKRGLLLSAKQLEDIFGDELIPKIKPFGGKVHGAASKLSQTRDHWFRIAHFIDAVGKSKAKTLEEAFDSAAHEVRKWHPDGMDLTNFERKYLRRVFPFYSWQRKAIPLVLKSLVEKPGKVLAYPKGMEALQAYMGVDAPSRSDPFPVDQLFPDWVKEGGIGPIAKTGMGGLPGIIAGLSRQGADPDTGEPIGGYTLLNPGLPFTDAFSEFAGMGNPSDPIEGALGMVTPFAKVPAELAFDKNIRTGAPVTADLNRYLTEQIPLVSILSRITGMGIAGPTERGEREGFNLEALINLLTGAGLTGTGPYQIQAHIEEGKRAVSR